MEAGEELEEVLETMSLEEMLRDYYCLEVPSMPGAADFPAALREKGLRVTAATLSPQNLAEKALLRNGLKKYIEKIFTAP
ncbi:MAG: hypothetical protein ACSW8K_08675 [bacterium]